MPQLLQPTPSLDKGDISALRSQGELVLIYDDKVYKVTKFAKLHPGGEHILKISNGTNVTEIMKAMHHQKILEEKLPKYCIGVYRSNVASGSELEGGDPITKEVHAKNQRLSRAYAELEQELIAKGFYQPQWSFYTMEVVKCGGLLMGSMYLGLFCERSVINYSASALLLTVAWHQGSFLIHDLAHRQVTFDRNLDYVIAVIISNLFSGTSVGWWKSTHNTHHVATNDPENDPDVQHMPFFAYTSNNFNSVHSNYYNTTLNFGRVSQFLISIQHRTFYLVHVLSKFNFYIQGFNHMINYTCPMNRLELLCTGGFLAWYGALLWSLPNWRARTVYFLLSHVPQALLHVQLTLNHSYMPIEKPNPNDHFVEHQLRTSMDIECPEWLDWFHGGLHFQSIHHLFPRLPRPSFRRAQPLVDKFCDTHHLVRHRTSLSGALSSMKRMLREVACQLFYPPPLLTPAKPSNYPY